MATEQPVAEAAVPERKAAISRQYIVEQKADDSNPDPPQADNLRVLEGSRAELLISEMPNEAQEPTEEASNSDQQQKAEATTESQLILGKFKTNEDVVTGYTELEKLTTKLAQRNAELEQLAAKPAEAVKDEPVELGDDITELLLSDPAAALKKVTDAVTKQVRKEQKADAERHQHEEAQKAEQSSQAEVVEWFRSTHQELAADQSVLRQIDALAYTANGKTLLEKYQTATQEYLAAKEVRELAAKAKQDREVMVKQASQPAARKPAAPNGKVWRRSEIDNLILRNPAEYARQAMTIAAAIREGRVREDL